MREQSEYFEALRRIEHLPVILQLDIGTTFSLVGLVQLALRHPGVADHQQSVRAAREFIEQFRNDVATREPLVAELVDMGNKEAQC